MRRLPRKPSPNSRICLKAFALTNLIPLEVRTLCYLRMKLSIKPFAIRRFLCRTLATRERLNWKLKTVFALLIFLISFATKSLQAVDLAPVMYTVQQPFGGLTDTYDLRAMSIIDGEGVIGPYDINPRKTVWIAQAPGYSIFLSVVYIFTSRNFFNVQLIQNLLNSLSPVLIFFIAGRLISWRVGFATGLLSAISHHLSHISNFILPDALSALPLLAGFFLLMLAMRYARRWWVIYLLFALAGVMLGLAAWMRSQTMLLGLFAVVLLTLTTKPRLITLKRTLVMAAFSLLIIAPITIKNYRVYGEFVPVNIGAGIVLWEGIGEESGDKYGAVRLDEEVAKQDAEIYGEPRYAGTWSSPDGIMRDRDRVKRSLAIITEHPVWYAGVMMKRAREMVKYSAHAPLIFKPREAAALTRTEPVKRGWEILVMESGDGALHIGRRLAFLRMPLRSGQRIAKEAMQTFIVIGIIAVLFLSRRRAAFLFIVPLYYFLFQGFFHTEFRYTLPMQYFVFAFAAVTWTLAITLLGRGLRKVIAKWKPAASQES